MQSSFSGGEDDWHMAGSTEIEIEFFDSTPTLTAQLAAVPAGISEALDTDQFIFIKSFVKDDGVVGIPLSRVKRVDFAA